MPAIGDFLEFHGKHTTDAPPVRSPVLDLAQRADDNPRYRTDDSQTTVRQVVAIGRIGLQFIDHRL